MMMEAQEIFGLDFDPAEFDQVARDGLVSEEEEEDEEVCVLGSLWFVLCHRCTLKWAKKQQP